MSLFLFCSESWDDMITGKKGFFQEYIFEMIGKRFQFKIRKRFFKRRLDLIIDVKGDLFEWRFFSVRFRIAMNSSNSAKRVFHRRIDVKDHSFSPNSEIELFLFNSDHCIGSVEKMSP
ncbi:hypothetical protein Tco_1182333 [Tanacetum coccineum]